MIDGIPRPLVHLLQQLARQRGGAQAELARQLDRAWRHHPEQHPLLVGPYAQLLAGDPNESDAALRMLERAEQLAPTTELAALLLRRRLAGGLTAVAHAGLNAVLRRAAVHPTGELACAAALALGPGAPGWMGLDVAGNIVGQHRGARQRLALQIGQAPLARARVVYREPPAGRSAGASFWVELTPQERAAVITGRHAGTPLFGNGLHLPTDRRLTGSIQVVPRGLRVQARFDYLEREATQLRISDDTGAVFSLRRAAAKQHVPAPAFEVPKSATALRGQRWTLEVRAPGSPWVELPDSPFLWPAAARRGLQRPVLRAPRRTPAPRAIAILIPVYDGLNDTRDCLQSVLTTTAGKARLVVIDDATPDPALAAHLSALAAAGHIELLRQAKNQGFVQAVNAGLARCATQDIVLLNSDTIVYTDWLQRLQAAAYSAPAVGTVTPFSSHGSIATYPGTQAPQVSVADAAQLDALAARVHPNRRVQLPVGVGFCLYLRRDCLDATGGFDAAVFGKGYGEETDFCLRASARGYRHVLAADTYVYHVGSRSFGTRREALTRRAGRLVNLRHPGYDPLVAHFLRRQPLQPLRRQLDEARCTAIEGGSVLLVTHALGGGVERAIGERQAALRSAGRRALILRPATAKDRRHVRLSVDGLEAPDLVYQVPEELSALEQTLARLGMDSIEVHHFLGLPAALLERLLAGDTPYEVRVHDYAWLCAQVTLVGPSGEYCGEPAAAGCARCVRQLGTALGEPMSVPTLRRRSLRWLGGAVSIIAPSADTARRYQRHFPSLPVAVRAPSAPALAQPHSPPTATGPIRVALLGGLSAPKGFRRLLACARDAARRNLALEFVVIGYTVDDSALERTGRVFLTGRYAEGEAPYLLRREAPAVILMASVCPETWCYALDPALESGLPVVAFDIGAIAERLRTHPMGILIPASRSAGAINDMLIKLGHEQRAPTIFTTPSAKRDARL